jgi:hypothetical protein
MYPAHRYGYGALRFLYLGWTWSRTEDFDDTQLHDRIEVMGTIKRICLDSYRVIHERVWRFCLSSRNQNLFRYPLCLWLFCLTSFHSNRTHCHRVEVRAELKANRICRKHFLVPLILLSLLFCLSHLSTARNTMQSAKGKANEMPPEPPAKRFLGGRQLIIKNIAPGTTKSMIAELLYPFVVVDDASLDELESGASLRRTVLVTPKRGHGFEEVDEAISRFPGTVLNGNLETLRLFGKPAPQTIQETSEQNRETFLSSPPDRMTCAEIRRRPVPLSPPPTAPTQSCAAGSEVVVKVEREVAVIVVHQYADVEIKQEPVAGSDFALSEGTERFGEGHLAGDRTTGENSTEDQESARVQDAQNIDEEHISSTIFTTPTSAAPR